MRKSVNKRNLSKKYRYVYVVRQIHSREETNLKEGDILFWRNVGEMYTIQVIKKSGQIKALATIELIAVLPRREGAIERFLEVLKQYAEAYCAKHKKVSCNEQKQ